MLYICAVTLTELQAVGCTEGHHKTSSGGCDACPLGSFCANGTLAPCGPNLTTTAAGAETPLECIPLVLEAAQTLTIQVLVRSQTSLLPCPNLAQAILGWLRYGTLLGCQLGIANYSESVMGLQCTVLAPLAYSLQYVHWLEPALRAQRGAIQAVLQTCSQQLAVLDASVVVPNTAAPRGGGLGLLFNNNNNNNNSLPNWTAPTLLYERRKWGQSQGDIVTLVGALLMLSCALCASCVVVTAGACAVSTNGNPPGTSAVGGSRTSAPRTGAVCPCSWI